MCRSWLAGVWGVLLAVGVAQADDGTITVTVGAPGVGGTYQLVGQSSFHQVHTEATTAGGQLDGTSTPGNVIYFVELFPPPTLNDYLTFGYFGVIQTLDDESNVVDSSLVVAFDAGEGAGASFASLFPSATYTEDELVAALLGPPDSAEFFDFANNIVIPGEDTNGVTSVPEILQLGETLDLIAFIGGTGGDEGVDVGDLSFEVSSVPEPGTLALLGAGGVMAAGRVRRRGR